MTALLRLFISLPLFLFAFSFKGEVNFYSDHLKYNVFDGKWKSIPSEYKYNRAFDNSFFEISHKNIGIFYISQGYTKINKGFIETWYYASNSFNTLLKRNDIGYSITEPKIKGKLVYYQGYGVFFKKNIKNFYIKFNLIKGKQLQYIKINGINTQNRFIADLDYVYTDKNIITHSFEYNNRYYGFGGSIDLGANYSYKNFYLKAKIQNILGFIKWYNVNYMKYHFDSNTRYIGEDGYYHYRPFGVGRYYSSNFYMKLPYFYTVDLNYQKNCILGDKISGSKSLFYNTLYLQKEFVKLGYIPEKKVVVFGLIFKHFILETVTNFNTKYLYQLSFNVTY